VALLAGIPAWATGKGEAAPAPGQVKITFPYFQVGAHVGAKEFAERNARFNQKFKGKYEVEIEEIAGDANYVEKIKVLYGAGKLPPVYEVANDPQLSESIFKNKKYVNLKSSLDADPEWRKCFTTAAIDNATYQGEVVALPASSSSYIGIFYNKELFQKAGIPQFPKTWDEFWVDCDKLEKSGVKAIALHTTEGAWCPNLMVSAFLAQFGQEAYDFARTMYPTDFTKSFFIQAIAFEQKLFKYAPSSAIGGTYPMAANDFYNSNAAMVPNGPWMIAQMRDVQSAPADFPAKVGYALYPGGVAIGGNHVIVPKVLPTGWGACSDYPPEVITGAVEWLKFISSPAETIAYAIAMGNIPDAIPVPDNFYEKLDPIAAEFYKQVKASMKKSVPHYQRVLDSVVLNEVLPQDLPLLALGQLTPLEFAQKLNEGAQRNQSAKNK